MKGLLHPPATSYHTLSTQKPASYQFYYMFQVCHTKIGWFDRKIVKNSLFTAYLDNDNSAQECPRLIGGIEVS